MNMTTERLILRTPRVTDAESYCTIHNSEFVLRYNAMMPTTKERMESSSSHTSIFFIRSRLLYGLLINFFKND